MDQRERTIGESGASQLGEELTGLLARGIKDPSAFGSLFRADPIAQTGLIEAGVDRLLKGQASSGEALQAIMQRNLDRSVGEVRSRFGQRGGTSLGTPAASAEALLRAEAVPRQALATQQLDLAAILPILQSLIQSRGQANQRGLGILSAATQLGGRGLPQAQAVLQPSVLSQITDLLAGATTGAAGVVTAARSGT